MTDACFLSDNQVSFVTGVKFRAKAQFSQHVTFVFIELLPTVTDVTCKSLTVEDTDVAAIIASCFCWLTVSMQKYRLYNANI